MRVACPICGRNTTWEENEHRPFCSERCRMVDLGHWASEGYRIPAEESSPPEDAPGAEGDGSTA